MKIRILREEFLALRRHLFRNANEQHAFLLAERYGDTLVVRECRFADPRRDLVRQSPVYLALQPSYVIRAMDRASTAGLHLIDVHSHPHNAGEVCFSAKDLQTLRSTFAWHRERLPDRITAAVVLNLHTASGMVNLPDRRDFESLEGIEVVGDRCEWWPNPTTDAGRPKGERRRFDRQIRAFGTTGQEAIGRLRVAVVGLGGTGSALVQQLAHLGVKRWILIDPDRVEASNLNRLIGACVSDARRRRRKTAIAARTIRRLCPDAEIEIYNRRIQETTGALDHADVVFGCGDNREMRSALCHSAAERLIPYLDLGTSIRVAAGSIESIGGQMFASWPGGLRLTDWEPFARAGAVRNSDASARRGAYGTTLPQPAVAYLNGVIASLAVGEFLKYGTGWQRPSVALLYDALRGSVTSLDPPAWENREATKGKGGGTEDRAEPPSYTVSAPPAIAEGRSE